MLVPYDAICSASILVPAFLMFYDIYHCLAPSWATSRHHAWILTATASPWTTLVSIPLFADYVSSGDVQSVHTLPLLTYTTCRVFQAHLLTSVSCSLLTCGVHHLLYICFVQYTIQPNVGGLIFFAYTPRWRCVCFSCIHLGLSQLPTFILSTSFLYRRLHSSIAFIVAFFMIHIMFHVIMFISYLIPYNCVFVMGES